MEVYSRVYGQILIPILIRRAISPGKDEHETAFWICLIENIHLHRDALVGYISIRETWKTLVLASRGNNEDEK